MRDELFLSRGWWRGLVLACVVALGLVTIVGSGGGGSVEMFDPSLTVEPPRINVQVGASAAFSVYAGPITSPTYQWSRAAGDGPAVAIAGATGATYTLAATTLADDGTTFSVEVRGAFEGRQVAVDSSRVQLAVSSLPGVVFQDSEFLPADWAVAVISVPASNGATFSDTLETTGGNPGAYRKVAFAIPAGLSSVYVFGAFQPLTYDPASQGAIYLIEFTRDCIALPSVFGVEPSLLLEQDGRRYIAGPWACTSAWPMGALFPSTFGTADFRRFDGPGCVAGESCPDFTVTGKPIRFGFANSSERIGGIALGASGFGIDNWKVTVWRK